MKAAVRSQSLPVKFIAKIILLIGLLISASTATWAAFNYFHSLEAEGGSLSGNVATIADASSSSNSAVKFGQTADACTPSNTGAGGYPLPDQYISRVCRNR